MSENYFKNKTIWVIGASSGIGAEFANSLSTKSLTLILSSRNEEKLKLLQAKLSDKCKSHVIPIDLNEDQSIKNALVEIDKLNVDIVIFSGGLSQRSLAVDTEPNVDEYLMKVNYMSTVKITKHLLPKMLERKFGHLVLISSVVGKIGSPYRSGYAASKHALHGFYDSLRAELEDKGIYSTIICPGYILTNISYNALKGDGKAQNKMDPHQAKGMNVKKFTKIALRRIARKKAETYIGGIEIIAIYLKRYFPSILRRIVKNVKP